MKGALALCDSDNYGSLMVGRVNHFMAMPATNARMGKIADCSEQG